METRFAGYALVAALLSAPLAAKAQVAVGEVQLFYDEDSGPLEETEINHIGLAGCEEGGIANLRWVLRTSNGFVPQGEYRFIASDDPAESDGSCPEEEEGVTQNVQFWSLDARQGPASNADIQTADIPAALGFACEPGAGDRQLTVCVEWWVNNQRLGAASGRFTLQLRSPPPPTNVRVTPSEEALIVEWDEGRVASGQAESFEFEAVARAPDGTERRSRVRGESTRIDRLVNETTYEVFVVAYSRGNNPSEPSATVTGAPVPIDDFWEHYKNLGGTDSGGCASGPAGLGALAGVGLALALRRRRA